MEKLFGILLIQTKFGLKLAFSDRLVLNLSENGNYNPNLFNLTMFGIYFYVCIKIYEVFYKEVFICDDSIFFSWNLCHFSSQYYDGTN